MPDDTMSYGKCLGNLGLTWDYKKDPEGVSREDIRTAYNALALIYHPDKHKAPPGEEEAYAERFRNITESYQLLRKAQYKAANFKDLASRSEVRNAKAKRTAKALQEIAEGSPAATLFQTNIQSLLTTLAKWSELPQANLLPEQYLNDHRQLNKKHQRTRLLNTIATHFDLLLECSQRRENRQLDDTPWNTALVETTALLSKAVKMIDDLPNDNSRLLDIELLFKPIEQVIEKGHEAIQLLNKIKRDPNAMAVYNDGLMLTAAFLQRANSDFADLLNFPDYAYHHQPEDHPVNEMKSLCDNFLKNIAKGKDDTKANEELKTNIEKYTKDVGSTSSLYWKKFINSVCNFLGLSFLLPHYVRDPKRPYFNEHIKKNKFVNSVTLFSSPKQEEKTSKLAPPEMGKKARK